MPNFRKIVILAATGLIMVQLILLDYQELGWTANSNFYIGVLAMLLVIISMLLSKRIEGRKGDN